MESFDLDGVLCELPEEGTRIERYENAKKLFTPTKPFIVITARSDTEEITLVTKAWLAKNFGSKVKRVYLRDARIRKNVKNVAYYKAQVITDENVTAHTEDYIDVLKLLEKSVDCKLFLFKKGFAARIPFSPLLY